MILGHGDGEVTSFIIKEKLCKADRGGGPRGWCLFFFVFLDVT